ncbi:expressed unknown protein [Seminavis robusta]|uniref:Uncharacterized protein n=1 Tax=Seminavis robusta TaxID=568900 RepID=A0A9N8DQ65_9STRA|nr:expressed unknown protein [Seminavis robusta]|eukprot:Sro293_g109860.1 n/a (198) ;mRNA; r:27546-28139
MTKQTSSSSMLEQQRKRVTFGSNSASEAPELYALDAEQCEVLWFSRAELAKVYVSLRKTLRKKGTLDESRYTRRGLEQMLNKGLPEIRKNSVQAILQIQAAHKKRNDSSMGDVSQSLAAISMELNRDSVSRGILLGARDMAEARRVYAVSSMTMNSAKIADCYSTPTATTAAAASAAACEARCDAIEQRTATAARSA